MLSRARTDVTAFSNHERTHVPTAVPEGDELGFYDFIAKY